MKDHYSIDNMPESETSVPFVYPTEQIPNQLKEQAEEYIEDEVRHRVYECINRLTSMLSTQRRPDIILKMILFNCNMLEDGDGFKTSLAKELGITRQSLNYYNKKTLNIIMSMSGSIGI